MASKSAAGAETVETRDEQVEGLLLDTQSAAVKKLINKDKVCAIIGPSLSGCSMATVPVVTEAQIPMVSCASAAIITTLLISSVIGFNLLRPLLTSAFKWTPEEDALLRDQLARAMVGLAGPKGADSGVGTKAKR